MKMTIDPGVSGTGYAIWDDDWKLVDGGNIYASSSIAGDDWVKKAIDIEFSIRKLILKHRVTYGAMEFPRYFSSAGGEMVAKTGDLLKLTFLCGVLYNDFDTAILVPVNQWKGQLPKTVVEHRIRNILGFKVCEKFKSHTFDAIGIGLYLAGRF